MVALIAWIILISFIIFTIGVLPRLARKSDNWMEVLCWLSGDFEGMRELDEKRRKEKEGQDHGETG